MLATTKQLEEEQKPESAPQEETTDWRARLRAAYENLNPLTKEEAEMINKAVMEARERSIGEHLSS